MPYQIARTGNNLPAGNFVPEIWSKKLQSKFYSSTIFNEIANTNWEGEIKGKGSKVIIRVRPTVIVEDDVVGKPITYQELDDAKLELLINKMKRFAFMVEDMDQAQSDINIINETTTDSAEQMKIAIDKDVLGSVYADATSTITSQQVTAANVVAWAITAGEKLDELNIPEENRWFAYPPWVHSLLMQSDLKAAYITGDGKSPLRNGKAGNVDRFQGYKTNNLAGAATSGSPTYCMAGSKDAITFASQVVKVETLRLQDQFGDAIRGRNAYGFKVTTPNALVSMPAYK